MRSIASDNGITDLPAFNLTKLDKLTAMCVSERSRMAAVASQPLTHRSMATTPLSFSCLFGSDLSSNKLTSLSGMLWHQSLVHL